MKIGILSDSHDNLTQLDKAVRLFNIKKVGFVLHAGDFISPFTIARLKNLDCDWCGVFGNNDGEKKGLFYISQKRIKRGPLRLKLNGKKITLVHDINEINPVREKADLIIFGHTHQPKIKKENKRLLVNPGECGGWLSKVSSVVILDLDTFANRLFKI